MDNLLAKAKLLNPKNKWLLSRIQDILTEHECRGAILRVVSKIMAVDNWLSRDDRDARYIDRYINKLFTDGKTLAGSFLKSKEGWGHTVSLVTFAVVGNVPGMVVKSIQLCRLGTRKIKNAYETSRVQQDAQNMHCTPVPSLVITDAVDSTKQTPYCKALNRLVHKYEELQRISGTLFYKILFLMSLTDFMTDDAIVVEPQSAPQSASVHKGKYGALFELSDLYNSEGIRNHLTASQLVKDVFNMVSSNIDGRPISIPIKLKSDVSQIVIERINDKYGLAFGAAIDTTGKFDRFFLNILHLMHHDVNDTFRHIFSSYHRVEFEDAEAATADLIFHIASEVCKRDIAGCDENKNGLARHLVNVVNAAEGSSGVDHRGDWNVSGGRNGNATTSCLLLAVLLSSSIAGSLRW